MLRPTYLITLYFSLSVIFAQAQQIPKSLAPLFTTPLSYQVGYTSQYINIDGKLDEAAWQQAAWTNTFQDIEGNLKSTPAYLTRVKMLWGDTCLYIAAQLQEPHVWATLKKHDDIIFNNNDFEVFINPNNTTHQYFEIEVNALNTLFDLFLNKPYRNQGNAMFSWDAPGLKSAVKVEGTTNDPEDTDTGWTVEMAIPFKAISLGNDVQTPAEGTFWRINFSRVEWDTKIENGQYSRATDNAGKRKPEHNWVWSQQGVVNMHYPERWGYLQFTKQNPSSNFELPYAEKQRRYLWLIYYLQNQYWAKHKRYATSLKQLKIADDIKIDGKTSRLKLEANAYQFTGLIANADDKFYLAIDQEGLVHTVSFNNK